MKTKLGALVLLGLSSGVAQADITANGTHVSTNVNQREEFFVTASTTATDNIYIQSQASTTTTPADWSGTYMDGYLSVWQETGSNWTLVASNDNAPRQVAFGPTTIYNQSVLGWSSYDNFGQGQADPGLSTSLVAGNTYMIVQSNANDTPLGTIIPLGQSLTNYFSGKDDATGGGGGTYTFTNNYTLTVTGTNAAFTTAPTSAVPVPGAIWLFASGIAGLGVFRKKQSI
ncbi:hypothetical protein [Methylomonas sp. AM2-LC]|uniref:hypothetical protein n=1 Tax=Methylomonas sp. AM2-LC TaxID=3153301 RepID=UPI0032656124